MKKLTKKIFASLLILTLFCSLLPLTANAEGYREQLEALVAQAETIQDDNYTGITWSAFASTRADAKLLLANENATDEQIINMINFLQSSMNNLKKSPTGLRLIWESIRNFFMSIIMVIAMMLGGVG